MKKNLCIAAAIVTFFAAVPLNNYAANGNGVPPEELKLYVGQIKIVPVKHPSRIVIGNPEIADIAGASVNEITLSPKTRGTTTLVYWDALGEQSFKVKVFSENILDIKERIDNVLSDLDLPDIRTEAAEDEGKVMLLGSVKTSAEREKAMSALGTLKDKIVDLILVQELESTVEIDVQVIELDKGSTDTLGFTWPGSITLTDNSGPVTTAVTGLKNVFYLSKFTRTAFNVTLDALVQEGKARILSRPRLACQSGKEAELLVGGEKPIFTTTVAASTGAAGTEVEYKEYGIKLKMKPVVTADDRVKLVLNVEVSEVGDADTIGSATAPTAKAYPLSKRTTATELFLNNGQTMAISGLIKEKTVEEMRRTPFLSNVPFLGGAFRKKTTTKGGGATSRENTELFIMLTPSIIDNTKKEETVKKPAKKEEAAKIEEEAVEEKKKEIAQKEKSKISKPIIPQAEARPKAAPGPLETYTKIIQRRVVDNLSYPEAAKVSGFQGTVKLAMHLSYSGQLLDVTIKNSSGYKVLDDDAVNVARKISYYPPFPPAIEKKELWVDIPIDYRLN